MTKRKWENFSARAFYSRTDVLQRKKEDSQMRAGQYATNMKNILSLYKLMSLRDHGTRSPYQPFLHRNLSFVMAYKGKEISEVRLNHLEIISPPMWDRVVVATRPARESRTFDEKRENLMNLVRILKKHDASMKKSLREIARGAPKATAKRSRRLRQPKIEHEDYSTESLPAIDIYTGKYRPFKESLAKKRLDEVKSILKNLQSLTLFPTKLHYSIVYGDDDAVLSRRPLQTKSFNHRRHVNGHRRETIMLDAPLNCVICGRAYRTLFHLMLHYHLTYPRLCFTIRFDENGQFFVNIEIAKKFRDVDEVSWRKRGDSLAFWLMMPRIARGIRALMRTDLSMFFEELPDLQPMHNEDVRRLTFQQIGANHRRLRPGGFSLSENGWPMPESKYLEDVYRKRIFDFLDVTYHCKVFMFTWNMLRTKIGELYILIHKRLFAELGENFRNVVVEHVLFRNSREEGSASPIAINDCYKVHHLVKRIKDDSYDPINDRLSPPKMAIVQFMTNLNLMYKKAIAKNRTHNFPIFAATPLSLVEICALSNEDCTNLLMEILALPADILPPLHSIRLMCEAPGSWMMTELGFDEIPKCLFDIPPYPENNEAEFRLLNSEEVAERQLEKGHYIEKCK
ncbi:unnamed protein product [Caenorhabditis bovis]|uniref:Uncharacterized protein n=1 Tax=Caenorhabditis bovis TaxID=2654633 RepID=A0A8S1F356_9PELO|nr:unnamed protein product [Caenorhabditis bovis]